MWFSTFLENLVALPVWAWVVWALVVVCAVVFFALRKRSGAALPIVVVLLLALAVLFAFALPTIEPEDCLLYTSRCV